MSLLRVKYFNSEAKYAERTNFNCLGEKRVLVRQKNEFCIICTNEIYELIERNEGSRPLGHLEGISVFQQADHLYQYDSEMGNIITECLHNRINSWNIAMVVRTPDIDEDIEPPPELVPVIGHVGRKVGIRAIRLDQRPVDIVAEIGARSPFKQWDELFGETEGDEDETSRETPAIDLDGIARRVVVIAATRLFLVSD